MAILLERRFAGFSVGKVRIDNEVKRILLSPLGRKVTIAPWVDYQVTEEGVTHHPRLEVEEYIPPLENRIEATVRAVQNSLAQAFLGLAAAFDYSQNFSYPDEPSYTGRSKNLLQQKNQRLRVGPWWNQVVFPTST